MMYKGYEPWFDSTADYTTNAKSYYDKLAKDKKLLELLSKRIWEYDKTLHESLEEVERILAEVINKIGEGFNQEIYDLLIKWVEDGTLDEIINETLMNKKADITYVDALYENVTAQLAETTSMLESKGLVIDGKSLFMDGVNDDSIIINQVLLRAKELGVSVHLPSGQITIKKPIVVEGSGVSLKAASAYKTRIVAHPDFVGEQLILVQQGSERVAKGMGIPEGIYVDCKGVNAHGIVVVNAYDQHKMLNCEVRNVHLDKNAYRYITDSTIGLNVSQTVLFENSIGEHIEGVATAPVYYFERVQEMTLLGNKAFINKANSTVLTSGTGFHFKDCRGVTMLGNSAAFGLDAIVWESDERPANGLTVLGQTNEKISGYALKTIKKTHNIDSINVHPIRSESGRGDFDLDGINLSTLFTGNSEVLINGTQNTIFSSSPELVTGRLRENTVIGTAKFGDIGAKISTGLTIMSEDYPYYDFKTNDGKRWRIRLNASETYDGGLEIQKEVDGVLKTMFKINNDGTLINDAGGDALLQLFSGSIAANATNLSIKRRSGEATVFSRISVGAADSGGSGNRILTVPN